MNRKRVLVLGASGFIGKRVVDALLASDWAIPIAAYHKSPPANLRVASSAMDATDEAALEQALPEVDAVVNCVAGSSPTIIGGAQALFAIAAKQAAPPRIVHLSTMSVYGSASGEVDESSPLKGDLGAYSSAKVAAEQSAAQYSRTVILRPGCVYGPGSSQWSERIARLLIANRLGDLGQAGEGLCNLIYIDDLVAAILQALQLPDIEGQAFNLSMPAPPTWNQYLQLYAQALGIRPLKRISSARLLLETLLLAPPIKAAEIVLRIVAPARHGGMQAIPRPLLKLFGQGLVLKVSKAEQVLGLNWTPMSEGLTLAADGFHALVRAQSRIGNVPSLPA